MEILTIIEQELRALAEEHDGAADNEYIWALGAPDAEGTAMHTDNMAEHRRLAMMYRAMAENVINLLEEFGGN
jgi:hypothetical protein